MELIIDYLYFYTDANGKLHNTNLFELVHSEPKIPIVRRGQSFNLGIKFKNRNYNRGRDLIRIIFSLGEY